MATRPVSECVLEDQTLKEEFRKLKKRDLTETYLFKIACGSCGGQGCSSSAFRKHILDKLNTRVTRAQPRRFTCALPDAPESDRTCTGLHVFPRYPGNKPVEHPDWISERKAFREALDGMGDLRKWLHNKPVLTDLEIVVMERERRAKAKKMPSSQPETCIYASPDAAISPGEFKHDVEEVKRYLRTHDHCARNLAKLLDWHGTGKIKRADLRALFKQEGLFIHPERLDALMFSLKSQDGKSVAVDDLAAAILAWSRNHQEFEGQNSDSRRLAGSRQQTQRADQDQEDIQNVEVLAIMQRVLAATKISCPSSLSGPMGREVDRFRGLCFREYVKSLEQCQQQGLNVSQATLQRAMLHPGDMDMSKSSTLGGKGHFLGRGGREQWLASLSTPKTHQVQNEEVVPHRGYNKIRKKQSVHWADPNAFWPGREDHVRLFLPAVSRSPAMVLFQRIESSASSSPGNWPINHLGYSTSGDIEARKTYTL